MNLLRKTAFLAVVSSWLFLIGCGDTYRPVASPIPQPSGDPQLVDTVAVLNQNPLTSTSNGSLSLIDVGGDSNLGNFSVGLNTASTAGSSQLITYAGSNSFIVTADPAGDTVTIVNIATSATTTVSLPQGSHPSFVAATATTGQILVAMQQTASNANCPSSGAIGIIPASTAALTTTVTTTVCVDPNPSFIRVLPGDQKAIVLDQTHNTARFVNIAAGTVSPALGSSLAVGVAPISAAATADGATVYVLNQEASGSTSDITVIDAVKEVVTSTAPISTAGTGASFMLLDRRLTRLYVSNTGSNTVSIFDASVSSLPLLHGGQPLAVGTEPVALAVTPDGSKVYVANTGANSATIVNASNFSVSSFTYTNDPGALVKWVAVSKDGTKAYIAAVGSADLTNTITILGTSNGAVVGNISPPPQDSVCTSACSLQRPIQIAPRM